MADFLRGPDYLKLPRRPETFLIEDILPAGGLLNIYGAPKMGKSWLAMQIADAVAHDRREVLGWEVNSHGPVLYLQADMPREEWMDRVQLAEREGLSMENIYLADLQIIPYPFNALSDGAMFLERNIGELQPVLVVIDTIREVHGGDENDSGHMRNVVNFIVKACRPAAVIFVSHQRKGNGESSGGDLMAENRGSNYVAGRMDCVIKVDDTRVHWQSRTCGVASSKIRRTAKGMLLLDDPMDTVARDLVAKGWDKTVGQLGKDLCGRFPHVRMNEKTAESRIRRLRLELGKNGTPVNGVPVSVPIPTLPTSSEVLFGGVLPSSGNGSGSSGHDSSQSPGSLRVIVEPLPGLIQ
jgi:hypothetical protein